jgi:hypothetical protein
MNINQGFLFLLLVFGFILVFFRFENAGAAGA